MLCSLDDVLICAPQVLASIHSFSSSVQLIYCLRASDIGHRPGRRHLGIIASCRITHLTLSTCNMQQCALPRASQSSPTASSKISGSIASEVASRNGTSHSSPESSILPHHSISESQPHSLEAICRGLHSQIYNFLDESLDDSVLRNVQEQIRIALDVIAKTFDKFELEALCFSYNGGKDCLVLLVLYLAGLWERFGDQDGDKEETVNGSAGHATTQDTTTQGNEPIQATTPPLSTRHSTKRTPRRHFPTSLTSIYIQSSHPFPEVTSFVESSSAYYHLDLVSSSLPMKQAFEEYLNQHKEVQAIFVGTRRTDPHGGNLTFWDVTDRGWPKFTR
jgi:hypothetical protein